MNGIVSNPGCIFFTRIHCYRSCHVSKISTFSDMALKGVLLEVRRVRMSLTVKGKIIKMFLGI
jgi:hypothetical protein